ncbi:MAG: hypothetical protein JJ901_01640 [Erythrobacter sp.]|uniref:hypothetical protein n=1 Tax=Erythrobacter sp. TaxID=1042 RepID=UPI001B03B851|nr:hypothetical protein [Erythrobacter sp.]MBO6766989.1 hypothetical protein [Erythrobacter sp.]
MANQFMTSSEDKEFARLQYDLAMSTKKISQEEFSHAARWIMASVLAINSGGLIAALGAAQSLDARMGFSIAAFYLGVLTAMTMGWMAITNNQRSFPYHSRWAGVWQLAAVNGELDEEEMKAAHAAMIKFSGSLFPYQRLGWVSFALFSVGLVFFSLSLSGN